VQRHEVRLFPSRPLAQIQAELEAGWRPQGAVALEAWEEGGKRIAKALPVVG